MRKRSIKMTAVALLCAGCMFSGGCLGGIWNTMWRSAVPYVAWSFLLDNSNVYNLFPEN